MSSRIVAVVKPQVGVKQKGASLCLLGPLSKGGY